jgi:hypothetical protein
MSPNLKAKKEEGKMRKFGGVSCLGLVASLFLASASGLAQVRDRYQAGIHFLLGFPQGEFRRNVPNAGIGVNLSFAYHFPHSLFSIGLSAGLMTYGRETRWEPLGPNIPDVTVKVTTDNSIILCHLFFRVQPQKGMLRPYLDALIGFNYLTTDTSIHGHDDYWDDDHDWFDSSISSNNYEDVAFSYGVGGGAMINLLQAKDLLSGRRMFSMDLDVGVRYIRGGRAEYLKEGSIHRQNGTVSYDVYRSRTDLLNAYIGLFFNF